MFEYNSVRTSTDGGAEPPVFAGTAPPATHVTEPPALDYWASLAAPPEQCTLDQIKGTIFYQGAKKVTMAQIQGLLGAGPLDKTDAGHRQFVQLLFSDPNILQPGNKGLTVAVMQEILGRMGDTKKRPKNGKAQRIAAISDLAGPFMVEPNGP